MDDMDTRWFTDTLADRQLSQRRLAKLLGCDPASVNRLVHGQRALRFDEPEKLAPLLGVSVSEVIQRAGVDVDSGTGATTHLVGYIDGAGEAHIDWRSRAAIVETLPDLPRATVAVQYRTAMTNLDAMDGWVLYVEPPDDNIEHAMGRLSLVCLDCGMLVLGFLRRGYTPGTYNVAKFHSAHLENIAVRWATPILLLRP